MVGTIDVTQPYEKVAATFRPRRIDDLAVGAAAYIDRAGIFEALFLIAEGHTYAGEWAMKIPEGWDIEDAVWLPEGDLDRVGASYPPPEYAPLSCYVKTEVPETPEHIIRTVTRTDTTAETTDPICYGTYRTNAEEGMAMNERDDETKTVPQDQKSVSPALREALAEGKFTSDSTDVEIRLKFHALAKLAGVTREMVEAAIENFEYQPGGHGMQEQDSAQNAFVVLLLLSGNASEEMVRAAEDLLKK